MAPKVLEIFLIINKSYNKVRWFDKEYLHHENSIYLSMIVEHIPAQPMPSSINIDEDFYLIGDLIEKFKSKCEGLNIKFHDLCLGNIIYNEGTLYCVDIHKWK